MVKVYDLNGTAKRETKAAKVFTTDVRLDLIKRAVLALQASRRQPYGTDFRAGLRTSARYRGVKDTRHSMKNREMARLQRTIGSSPAQEYRARRSPQTAGGRRAHPPKVEKVWKQKVNKKEMVIALKSAIAATASAELVSKRGHKIPDGTDLPIVVDDSIQNVKKVKDLRKALSALKLDKEMQRGKRRIRAGRGKMRGRRYKKSKTVLIVVDDDKALGKFCKNITGVDITALRNMNVEMLAPGCTAGRLTLWSESAMKKLGEMYG